MRTSYDAALIKPSGIVGDSVNIETRKFTRSQPKRYDNCEDNFYVIHTQYNTTVTIDTIAANDCIFQDEEGVLHRPHYIQTKKDVRISGPKFIIESLDKNITKQDKYKIKKLTGTHKAQLLTTKYYTKCSLVRERDEIIRSSDYDTLVAIKEEKKIASGPIYIT